MNLKPSSLLPTTRWALAVALCLASLLSTLGTIAHAQSANADAGTAAPSGPIRLRQPGQADLPRGVESSRRAETPSLVANPRPAADKFSDFETYVRKLAGAAETRRFGTELIGGFEPIGEATDYNPLVPPEYLLRAGDELVLSIWGSVDADLRLQVDRSGRISIPRVGPVMVSGVRYADLPDVISKRVAQVFKNFQLSVTLGQLRGVRIFVTGFVAKPGPFTVSGLSAVAQALTRAGGPSTAGSFRDIQLRRGRNVVASFDLYDLLLKGDRAADQLVQADDVIHVGPVGPQVAVIGSVNRPAIFETKPGETVDDVLRMAGGFSAVADTRRIVLERMDSAPDNRVTQLPLPAAARSGLNNGDVLRALNAADVLRPIGLQNKRVRIEGEVARPGEYMLPPASTLDDALRAAGGPTSSAYVYAADFSRESVRQTQQQNYERALRDFETQITTATATRRTSSADEANAVAASSAANARLLEQLRSIKPTGRIVLQVTPSSDALPELVLEDGDRLYLPARPNTVGVFGSVFSTGSYLHSANRTVGDYLRLAGGPTRGADETSVFVIRANGTVSSSLQESGFFARGNQIANLATEPGDTIFVPEELNKADWAQITKDWTQILYQFGLGIAGVASAIR